MPLEAPNLDTRTFDEIYEQARLRIPRYTPEYGPAWTDFNESDPGVALVQLFAWLTEMMLYKMNRVPERNYIKLLQLLDIELAPARPARAHLTFAAQPGADTQPVRRGAQFGAQSPETGELLIFETEAGLELIRAPLAAVRIFDGSAFSDATGANDTAETTFRPLGWVPQVNSALYLGFAPTDPPAVGRVFPPELRFRVFLSSAAQAGAAQQCEDGGGGAVPVSQGPSPYLDPAMEEVERLLLARYVAQERRDDVRAELRQALARRFGWRTGRSAAPAPGLVWEYKQRPDTDRWRRLNLFEDETQGLTREGYILVEGPAEIRPTLLADVPDPYFWLRCRLERGTYPAGRVPEIDAIRPNTVPAVNLSTVREEVLGTSDGRPDQTFQLERTPVEPGSPVLEVTEDEEEGPVVWTRVDDLYTSGPDDRHYSLSPATGEIRFGDGRHGQIPLGNAEIVAGQYRTGGGAAGNVAAGLINVPLAGLVGVESVINERAAAGGADEQAFDDLRRQAPGSLRRRNRAVTAEDYASLVVELGGVARATALPLSHPDHPGVAVPGAVTVVVVPDTQDRPPRPSGELIQAVCDYLEDYRVLTAEVYVKGPEYIRIEVEARVAAAPYAGLGIVARDVQGAVNEFLSPLGRRTGRDGQDEGWSWEFGQDLYPSNLFGVIQVVEGVAAVLSLDVLVNGRRHANFKQPVVLPPDGLVYGTDHQIVVVPSRDM